MVTKKNAAKATTAKAKNATVKSVTVEQDVNAQTRVIQEVGKVVKLAAKPQANESGKDSPAKIADVREAFHLDIEKFRKAFADSAKADTNTDSKTAVCADLFKPIRTWEELKQATRHAIYGYIHGRAGKQEAEKWFGLKKQSEHELYKVAANAVKRAKDRAEKEGWVAPKAPNADVDRAPRDKKAPGEGSELLSALHTLLNTDPEFTTALSYAVANPAMFKAWARSSAEAANDSRVIRAA
ncbi:hypothetical protein ACQKRQ_34285 [Paraburkholderia sp. NPDC080076]|uniref:hypothetical protein n=1 Tax=Paraburkholderia sp. NPDC080076 TaxID=3390605 RepID=UPI003D054761